MINLFYSSVITVVLSIGLYLLEKKTCFGKLDYKWRQLIIGILFGCSACFATEFNFSVEGVGINVRDSAPLCAGLLFGAPSGIIAGLIGGLERWVAVMWGAGMYTRLACSVSCVLAGLLAAVLRKFMFDNKRPSCLYGIAIAVVCEVIHMLMIFFTNMSDLTTSFTIVKIGTLPMILANAITLGLVTFLISSIGRDRKKLEKQRELALAFQFWLLVSIIIAFGATSTFTVSVQSRLAEKNAESMIELTLNGVSRALEKGKDEIDTVIQFAPNCHIGQKGNIIICDSNLTILTKKDHGKSLAEINTFGEKSKQERNVCFQVDINGEPSFCMYTVTNGYFVIGYLPVNEAMFFRNVTTYVMIFVEVIIFAVLFVLIYILIKKLVVDNIGKINNSLEAITNGNLEVTVDVRSHKEFASLSDDINSTVTTLKKYIAEAAARIDKELEFAKQIQHSALPSVFPPFPNRKDFDIYASMNTAKEVGGDFYDFYFVGENKLAILIADVSGKGIPAAMFMMTSKTIIKSLAESGLEVNDVFTEANSKLCENNEADMFVTAWMGVIDLQTGLVKFASAGHNPPYVKRGNGEYEYFKTRSNPALAAMDGVKYRIGELILTPGDVIYLYTDGVTEATDVNNQLYGEERLCHILNTTPYTNMEDICVSVKRELDDFVGEAPQFDDITMLAFQYIGGVRDEGVDN